MIKGRPGLFENCECGCPRIAHHPDPKGRCNACGCVEFTRVGKKALPHVQRQIDRAIRANNAEEIRKTFRAL